MAVHKKTSLWCSVAIGPAKIWISCKLRMGAMGERLHRPCECRFHNPPHTSSIRNIPRVFVAVRWRLYNRLAGFTGVSRLNRDRRGT